MTNIPEDVLAEWGATPEPTDAVREHLEAEGSADVVTDRAGAALVAKHEPSRFVYRARRQDDTTWWEVIRGYREKGDIEPGTECAVIRFLPQLTADAFAHALTRAFEDGRRQGYEPAQPKEQHEG